MKKTFFYKSELDGIVIDYMLQINSPDCPYIILVLPFGATFDSSDSFFDLFGDNFNIITWKSRHIFDVGNEVQKESLTVDCHVDDIMSLLDMHNIESVIIIGYCSGAAIALCSAAKHGGYFSSMFLICGEYALIDQVRKPNHYMEVDMLLKTAAHSIKSSTLIAKKFNEARKDIIESRESIYFNKPYYDPIYLHRYSINYINFIEVDFPMQATKVSTDTFVYCSNEDEHVGTVSSISIRNRITDSNLIMESFGDHYEFCKPGSPLLSRLKTDCMRVLS